MAARLDYAFRLLTAGARTLDRHRTLRATVDWGYDLLSEPERTVLCRLSVFAGGFDLEAAEAVVPDGTEITGGDVLDLLGRLVDRSWVGIEPGARGTRYRLLETIRQYAAEKLADSSDGDAVRRRHTDHFVGVATFLPDHPLRPPSWLARVDADQDNLGAALERSFQGGDIEACLRMTAGLSRFWGLSGRVIEGRAWLERVLEAAPAEGTVGTVGALNGMGFLLFQAGEPPALAAGFHERARAVAQAIGDRSGDSVVLTLARGDEDSYDSFTHALAALAPLTAVLGDGTRARGFADEAIEAARSLHLPHVLVMALTRAAETAVRLGDMARAAQHLAESLSLLKEMEGLAWVACSLELSALIAVARARHREAARLIGAAHALDEISAESSKARPLHDEVERCMAELGPVLGPEQLEAELAAGAAMPVKEVLTLALQELAPDA